ncbi:hypothetical protein [Mesorhizobium sp. WSM3879]|uniref:hypothetical protein n=1 Tax=Mesorhizobium sp. WSM3879 TaxID=2029406 RepID=UPI0015CE80BB|nr:hypothetical protein [Mesorhizobium sp. WSM3879]
MTTAAPLTRYGAVEGALPSGFATAELHHLAGHDPFIFVEEWDKDAEFLRQQARIYPKP